MTAHDEDLSNLLENLSLSSKYLLITTFEGLEEVSSKLTNVKSIAFDCEGVSLSRSGPCTLIQMLGEGHQTVFIIDLVICTAEMLEKSGVKDILENPTIPKLCWDGRMDCDALLHQFNIRVNNILDLQVVEVFERKSKGCRVTFVNGYAKAVENYTSLSIADQLEFSKKKHAIDELSFPNGRSKERSFEFWRTRPLTNELLEYAYGDVLHMFTIRDYLMKRVKKSEFEIRTISTSRINKIRDSPHEVSNNKEFAKVNF